VGGELNAYTTKEETFLYAAGLVDDAERAVDLLADLAFGSRFPEEELEKEREVVLDEIRTCEDNPSEALCDEFEGLLFPNCAMGHLILGNEASLRLLSADTCRAFARRFYVPENMVFFFYGKTPRKRVVRLVEKYFGGWATPPRWVPQVRLEPVARVSMWEKRIKELHQSHVILGTTAYGMHDEKRFGLHLLNNLLGGPGLNSRLNLTLREKQGLVYTVDSLVATYTDTGVFSIYFGCDRKEVSRCLRLIDKELQLLRDRALSSSQLHAAVKQLKGQMGVAADQREGVALGMGKRFLHYNRYAPLSEIFSKLDALTPSGLLEIANEVLDADRLCGLSFD
jgi:predicted Zn-dependent peptidase